MAQKARLISILANGMVDSTGAVVASGYARFYQPGTTTPITVYSDEDGSVTQSQPVTLDAGGRAEVYAIVPCRVVVKKSDDSTTVFDGNPPYVTAQQVSIVNANVNGGVETTLDAHLTNLESLGSYTESSGATARSYASWLREAWVSAEDFNTAADDSTDDAQELQAAITHCVNDGKATLFIPAGTYKIASGGLSVTGGRVNIFGAGPKKTILKFYGTAVDGLHYNLGVSTDYSVTIRDLSIQAATTSSGSALKATNANNLRIQNVEIAGFRYGIDTDGSSGALVQNCIVSSTDGNAAAEGISVGANGIIQNCTATGTSSNGTGFVAGGADVQIGPGVLSGWNLGISSSSQRTRVSGMAITVGSAKSGISLTGANSKITDSTVTGSTSTAGITASGNGSRIADCAISGCASGILAGAGTDVTVRDCSISGASTVCVSGTGARLAVRGGDYTATSTGDGLLFTGINSSAYFCTVTGSGSGSVGISLGGASSVAVGNTVALFASGITVGAVANCRIIGNVCGSNTADITINASATNYAEHSNVYTTLTDGAGLPHTWLDGRRLLKMALNDISSSLTPTFTPSITGPTSISTFTSTANNTTALTIAATSTTGLRDGDVLILDIINATSPASTINITWNSQYIAYGFGSLTDPASVATGRLMHIEFRWVASSSKWVKRHLTTGESAI